MTNEDIARDFCKASIQKSFGLSDERTEEYVKVIAELLDVAVENAHTPDKHLDEIGYVPKDDPRLDTIIGPPRSPDKRREE